MPAALIAVLALLAVACSGSSAAKAVSGNRGGAAAAAPQTAAQAANDRRLWIKEGAEIVPFDNGHELTVADMNVEIFVAPYPPGRAASLDFYVTQNDTPVDGAIVSLKYDMTIMEHGPFELLAAPRGHGHYLAPMEFAMTGDFWLNVAVDRDGNEGLIHLIVRAIR